jgi:MoaA/NifB/PqqE/SkfB family radical SAM enzyme
MVDKEWELTGEVKNLFKEYPVTNVRLVTNNKCNLNCKHCFYEYREDKGTPLVFGQWIDVVEKIHKAGITSINFFGKEPFYDDTVLRIVEYIQSKNYDIQCDAITNGVNVDKYFDRIIKCFKKLSLSVDNFNNSTIRTFDNAQQIKRLADAGLFIVNTVTITKNNLWDIIDIIDKLAELGSGQILLNLPSVTGNCAENQDDIVPDYFDVVQIYKHLKQTPLPIPVTFMLKGSQFEKLAMEEEIRKDGEFTLLTSDCLIKNNLSLAIEFHCMRFMSEFVISYDGSIFGCCSEAGSSSYKDLAIGNVLDFDDLKTAIAIGKESSVNRLDFMPVCAVNNNCSYCGGECKHFKYCYKKSCIIS